MPDPREIWAAAAGKSVRKSVEMIWPELAAALGGSAAGPQDEPQPDCARCLNGTLAIAKADDGTPVCSRHAADMHLRRSKHRVPHWQPGRRS